MAPPTHDMDLLWNAEERSAVNQMFYYSFIGNPDTLAKELASFVDRTAINELMVTTHVYDINAKIRSLELVASLFKTNRVAVA